MQSKLFDHAGFRSSKKCGDWCAGSVPEYVVNGMKDLMPSGLACHRLTLLEKLRICNQAVDVFRDIERDLDFVELFAGVAAVSKYLHGEGWKVLAMDIAYHFTQDCTHIVGMVFMTVMVMRVKAGGIVLSSPCCKSWLWMTRYTMGRHIDFCGDEGRADVAAANDTALFCAWLYTLLND
eukprot:10285934-Karenia_brevis.AAC.1